MFLLFGEMPVDVAFVQTLCECVHQQSRGNTDVEALGEAVHRDLDVHVGMLQGIVGEACLLGAEDYRYRLVERQSVGREIVLMRAGGHYLIAFAVKQVESLGGVELIHVVFMQVEPFGAADDDVWVDVVDPFVFDDMDVLNACQVAASEHCAGVVRLIDVFEHYGEVTCAVLKHLLEAPFSLIGDVIREKLV